MKNCSSLKENKVHWLVNIYHYWLCLLHWLQVDILQPYLNEGTSEFQALNGFFFCFNSSLISTNIGESWLASKWSSKRHKFTRTSVIPLKTIILRVSSGEFEHSFAAFFFNFLLEIIFIKKVQSTTKICYKWKEWRPKKKRSFREIVPRRKFITLYIYI